jgi:very-short-patch-repair endonuclease
MNQEAKSNAESALHGSRVESRPGGVVRIQVNLDRRINYAMQQNDVPVVHSLQVENLSELTLRNCRIRIVSDPEFATEWKADIEQIGPSSVYQLESVDLSLSPKFLFQLTERLHGLLRFEIIHKEEILFEKSEQVILLARNEWGGLGSLPEMIAAFTLPNHPAVERILSSAASILEKWTGDPSLSGYQAKSPKRYAMAAAAIYAAIQKLSISYMNPPASFEDQGQRIRLPDRILENKSGTCLDLAVLAAGCIEQAGLNAVIVFVKGHAFTGVWLKEECFSEPAIDEPLRLRKRVDLKEICIFDPTCVTARPFVDFRHAMQEARRRLDVPEDFLCAVDVLRARKGQIRPLPERVERQKEVAAGEESAYTVPDTFAVPDLAEIEGIPETEIKHPKETEASETRLDRWRRKLLDLSLRNRLLNFRPTKKTVQLLCPDLSALQSALAAGSSFHILPRPAEFSEADVRDPDLFRRRTGEDAVGKLLQEELKARRVCADIPQHELERRLIEIYRTAKVELEEGGASALYLALGFLSWYETPLIEQRRLAPILMLPLELRRKSVREGFYFQLSDDDPYINITLLEMLYQDFDLRIPELEKVPEDQSDLDLSKILRSVRKAVRDIERWDVLEIACVGFFSFTKFLMWLDLTERSEDLTKNAVVAHLVNSPNERFDPNGEFPNPERLDEEHLPVQTFCPLLADSSQLSAVFAAANGRSFVLEGPPGTGKSQTITNLIAQCLTNGKSVLFVSEKMAALNIVYSRLGKVGLGPFCLELHSNKAQKREVITQLDKALSSFDIRTQEEWEREAKNIEGLRNALNSYANTLHKRQNTGETVFQGISQLIGLRGTPRVKLAWSSPDLFDSEKLATIRDVIDRMKVAGAACGEVFGNVWGPVRRKGWSPAWEEKVSDSAESVLSAILALGKSLQDASTALAIDSQDWSTTGLQNLSEAVSTILDSPGGLPSGLLTDEGWDQTQEQIRYWIENGRRRDSLRAKLFEQYSEKILELDFDQLGRQLEKAEASRFPLSWFRYRSIQKQFKRVSKEKRRPCRDNLGSIQKDGHELALKEREFTNLGEEARAVFEKYWKDGNPDWDLLERFLNSAGRLRTFAARLSGNSPELASSLRRRWAELLSAGREFLDDQAPVGKSLTFFLKHFETFLEALREIEKNLDLDRETAWGSPDSSGVFVRISSLIRKWEENLPGLRLWSAWLRVREEAISHNLLPLLRAYEAGECPSGDLRRIFEASFYHWWISSITEREPVLNQFSSPEHERKIDRFKRADQNYVELTGEFIRAQLGQNIPSPGGMVVSNSELGILKREIGKKRNHMPVRALFKKIPNLLLRLKPCILMSPISVAQYLDATHPPFDVVVFDEASQIPVWDAIGAIARGKQAVIVGDPKQLPPTAFFQRMEDSEEMEDIDTVEDLESILDDCISACIPCLQLNWHYRSRHESLIAFSNYNYYGNRLLTFPSPFTQGMGVSWKHVVSGVYDKGKSRTNRAEAEAVVSDIISRLKDPDRSKYSIGVVTFSQAQQTLIEDLLEKARRDDSEIDTFFGEEVSEPVFVKNLENVQGDERDVILFSICYGPDASGRVSMNFGPMNKDGGERRLNVAITRARREVLVFSTLRAEQIDLARTRSRGVRDLKAFLEYAERGPSALIEGVQYRPSADFDSPFERSVHDALVNKGWEVHLQVGCSGYRIDLAVVDPKLPGRYLLGIECDGANYHRAKTARDRDRLREAVLRDLGWELHRVWSTDWWTNPALEVEKLEKALTKAARAPNEGPGIGPSRNSQGIRAGTLKTGREKVSEPGILRSIPAAHKTVGGIMRAKPALTKYVPTKVYFHRNSEDFYSSNERSHIQQILLAVVIKEGPIRCELASKRVAEAYGLKRVGDRMAEWIKKQIPTDSVFVQRITSGSFLWPKETKPEEYVDFRVPGTDPESVRSAEDLPVEEVANAAKYVLETQISLPVDDLARETARVFGFHRTGRQVSKRMMDGVNLLVKRGKAKREGAMITIG